MGGMPPQLQSMLIGFGVPVIICAAISVVLWYRTRSFVCPVCRKRIATDSLSLHEVRCCNCSWHLVAVPHGTESMVSPIPATCQACSNSIGQRAVRLWDGEHYCQSCVQQAAPGLAEYAAENVTLKETMPHTAWAVARRFLCIVGLPMVAFFGIPFGLGGGAEGFLVSLLLTLPITFVFMAAATYGFTTNRTSVSVNDGLLTVRRGSVWSESYELASLEWFEGNISQMNLMKKGIMPSGPAVLLTLPREETEQEKFVAVGYDDASRARWKGFLTLARLTRRTAWEQRNSPLRLFVNVLVGILTIPVSFVGCFFLGKLLTRAINILPGNQDIAEVVGLLVLVPGAVYVILYVFSLWPWRSMARVLTNRTLVEQRKMIRRTQYSVLLISIVTIGLPLMRMNKFDLSARITGVVIAVLSGWLVGGDLGSRVSRVEWASTDSTEKPEE